MPDDKSARCLIIVAKTPVLGYVKTRLEATLGEVRTCELYEAFLMDTVHTAQRVRDCALCLSFTPASGLEYFERLAPEALLLPQPEAPFGERLRSAFESAFARGFGRVILIGADTPHFGPDEISAAFDVLDAESGVIGPCDDGGYYLLGLRAPEAALFEGIDWSTDRVLQQTLERGRSAGLELSLLPRLFDIDEFDDLQRLRVLLDNAPPDLCPLTSRLMKELGAPGLDSPFGEE